MKRSSPGSGKPVKAGPVPLRKGMPVSGAFHAVMLAGLAHLQANERGVMTGRGPEHLHQMRVALRRLRSAVEIFGPLLPARVVGRVERDARWLGASLNPARDWDVFVMETLPAFERSRWGRGVAGGIAARCEGPRRRAQDAARRAVRSRRYRSFRRSLPALIAARDRPIRLDDVAAHAVLRGPVEDFASAVLGRRDGQVNKRGRGLGELNARKLHRLRIAIKKLRYAAVFFAGLYGTKAARDSLKRLARLQDILGRMNDAAMTGRLMAHDSAKDNLQGWSRARTAALRHELKRAWKQYRSAEKFW